MFIEPSLLDDSVFVSSFKISKYKDIMERVDAVDVSKDIKFQRTFNGFYKVRRNEAWRNHYYNLFQNMKECNNTEFGYVLEQLYKLIGNVEASFASKMIATLNPQMPIWDQNVLKNLGIKQIESGGTKKLWEAERLYGRMIDWYGSFLKTDNAHQYIEKFNQVLPDYVWVSDVKKIDFYLWGVR